APRAIAVTVGAGRPHGGGVRVRPGEKEPGAQHGAGGRQEHGQEERAFHGRPPARGSGTESEAYIRSASPICGRVGTRSLTRPSAARNPAPAPASTRRPPSRSAPSDRGRATSGSR